MEMLWSYIMYSCIRIRAFILVTSAVHANLQYSYIEIMSHYNSVSAVTT